MARLTASCAWLGIALLAVSAVPQARGDEVFRFRNLSRMKAITQEPSVSIHGRATDALIRLERLLDNPNIDHPPWRLQVWQQLQKLEHGPESTVLKGWQLLAQRGGDRDRANLILFQRRHSLELEPIQVNEGPEATLERCLHLWGEARIPEGRQALSLAVEKFPGDSRFVNNLHWIDLSPPAKLWWDAPARDFALGVLAARQPLH